MTTNMLNDAKRFTGKPVDQPVFCFFSYLFAKFINNIAGVHQVFGFFKGLASSFFKVFPDLLLNFREMMPGIENLVVHAE